jgi:hypothetical protein
MRFRMIHQPGNKPSVKSSSLSALTQLPPNLFDRNFIRLKPVSGRFFLFNYPMTAFWGFGQIKGNGIQSISPTEAVSDRLLVEVIGDPIPAEEVKASRAGLIKAEAVPLMINHP